MNSSSSSFQAPQDIESLLRAQIPCALPPALLSRLEHSIELTLGNTADGLIDPTEDAATVTACSRIRPRSLSPELLEKCEAILSRNAFPLDEKVLLFPKAHVAPSPNVPLRGHIKTRQWSRWGSVAAVAAIGALLALRSPLPSPNNAAVTPSGALASNSSRSTISSSPSTTNSHSGIVATSFGSGVQHASDEGVVWTPDHQAQRVIRVQYQDKVLVRDAQGIERMLLVPREEYLVVPEKVD